MRFTRLLTWLDVKRVIREETAYGRKMPDGILRIGCYSDALEIGVDSPDDIENASRSLEKWFGEWYRKDKESPAIQLDFGDAVLPVEFIEGEEEGGFDISVRPFWQEIAYLGKEFEIKGQTSHLPEPFPTDTPKLVSFYSFKGGVGRTLHLAGFLFALMERAKEIDASITTLVIDADIEAPGLTYWDKQEKQQSTVSFLDFMETYQYSNINSCKMMDLFAREIKKTPKREGKSTWYFLPACINDHQLLDTPVLPEHIARSPEGTWEFGDAIHRLGNAVGADYVLLDLRAGLSEISSPIVFDPRFQRFIVTTISEQSVSGTSLVIDQISRLAPPESETANSRMNYFDPTIIISMLKPEFRQLPNFENCLISLRSAYIESGEDNIYSKRLQILETNFNEELLYINDWQDARQKLYPTSIIKVARRWANSQIPRPQYIEDEKQAKDITTTLEEIQKLREICRQYEFAENGQGKGFLLTEPLKNLSTTFRDDLPRVVSIGAKGAGKTFNYIQLSQFGTWENFLSHTLKTPLESQTAAYIFPFLQSNGLKDEALQIAQKARTKFSEALKNNAPDFLPSECQDRIKAKLHERETSELEWSAFWIEEIAKAVSIFPADQDSYSLSKLNHGLKEKGLKIVLIFDGLEDLFPNIASDPTHQVALKSLIELPRRLSEIRQANIGVIIFLRRDFIRHTVTQNFAQFENLYQAYDLSWDEDSFRKLVFWICSQANVIDATEEEIDDLSRDELNRRLDRLWGMKLGSDNSREAYTVNWVFAALTDFKGRLQARDIVRFLLHAADISFKTPEDVALEKWSSNRILPPQSVRRALTPCSIKKVEEAKEEYPEFREWVEKIAESYSKSDRRVPFTIEQFQMDQHTASVLEEMGVIYEDRGKDDASRFYIPEIYREGLGFSLDKGARPRVLVLKRKALGPASF